MTETGVLRRLFDGSPRASRAQIARRVVWLLYPAAVLSNVGGALVVYLLAVVVIPDPGGPAGHSVRGLNEVLFFVYASAAILVGVGAGGRSFAPVRALFRTERPLDEDEQRLVLRAPLRMMRVHGALWGAASVCWAAVNVFFSPLLAFKLGLTVLLAGLTTCTIVYLLTERIFRAAVADVLSTEVPSRAGTPSVVGRSVLAWVLGSGVPVLGVVVTGGVAAATGHVSARQLMWVMLVLGGIALAVGLSVTLLAARAMADPIDSLRRALARVERQDLRAEVPVYDGSEIGQLQAGFNHMVAGLRERARLQDLFGRQVGEDVARIALERGVELGGELRQVAVIFVDLVGSTRLAATRPPMEVVSVLNDFFAVVVSVVGRYGGWINKFEGDAALAVFGAPVDLPDARTAALSAARELARRLEREVPEVHAAVGVSAGGAVAGHIGAEKRFEYTVIGDPVNEAARLSELAKEFPGRVLASGDALDAADEAEAARWRSHGETTVRGRIEPTRLAVPRTATDE
ncbi:adenylate/guanylate cyclase domain-containing protein [Actinomadura sp. DC4]|uniref:adenylate/guanylate cyclase domain-containing protein n=1 Tax=Actinomadura sp. DC4 TaxID=3055069 RepID=UPI0025B0044B|nr:adenylate/guanylate cyclase domain-containing protein [Actinomadura sp. DC4]MDN3359696.1 adenylate/guanylate cyclase domain-containing protein [Actinomadura sp. DC4]